MLAFGALVAALVPLLLGVTTVIAALGLVALPSHLSPIDSNLQSVILLIGLAVSVDYSLFYLRREREERAAGRTNARLESPPRPGPGSAHLRADGERGDGRHVPHRRQDLDLVRPGDRSSWWRSHGRGADGLPAVLPGSAIASRRVGSPCSAATGARPDSRASGRGWSIASCAGPWLAIVIAGGALIALSVPALNMNIAVTNTDDLPQDRACNTFDRIREAFPDRGRDR